MQIPNLHKERGISPLPAPPSIVTLIDTENITKLHKIEDVDRYLEKVPSHVSTPATPTPWQAVSSPPSALTLSLSLTQLHEYKLDHLIPGVMLAYSRATDYVMFGGWDCC